VIYQVGEKVLADFVLCHLDNPSDKLNLLMYDRLLNTPPISSSSSSSVLLGCFFFFFSVLCYWSVLILDVLSHAGAVLLVGTPQNLMHLVFLGFALKILQLHATEAFCSSRWHSSS
jgi:hypothetical protein